MNNDTLKELLSVYHSLQKDSLPEKGEGWVNMANFGPALLKAGIDYKGICRFHSEVRKRNLIVLLITSSPGYC